MVNEKRLIDANELLGKVDISKFLNPHGALSVRINHRHEHDHFTKMICDAPTVDAVEVVYGHWCWEGRFRACSECGSYVEFTKTLGASHWKYCPYCGAKMDGGNEDGICKED